MHSLASTSTPVAPPAIPIEWITSGIVTPVGAPVVSPAASVQTGWSPQPVFVDTFAGPSQAALAAQQQIQLQQQFEQQQQLAMTAASIPQPMAVAPIALAPAQLMAAPIAAPAPAPAPVPAAAAAPTVGQPAAGAPTSVGDDPTLVSSVAGAVAGFASATGRAVGGIAGAGTSRARRVGTELWAGVRSPRSIHVSQVPSKYNAAPAAGNKDCGPASVVMTLQLLGKSIPGAGVSAAPQKLINRVRQLAGNAANTAATTNHELGRALRAAGTSTREIADATSISQAVRAGKPVILNGNPRNSGAYGPTFNATQMTPYNGAHWVVVSGIDEKSGKFIINDPLSKVGPVKVTPAQLEAYRGGSMGIEVAA